jgi:hypothetical protein
MTRKIYSILSLATLAMLLLSCSVSSVKKMPANSIMPELVLLETTLDDYEFLGDVEIEVEYHRYFGLFKYINTINGEPNSRRNKNFVYLRGKSPVNINPPLLNRALIKAYKEYPEADFLMPAITTMEVEQLFLGRKVKASAKIKAYKMKK